MSRRYHITDRERDVIDEGLRFLEERDYPLAAILLRRIVKRACPDLLPNWASPPGHTIRDMLESRGMAHHELRERLGLGGAESLTFLLEGRLSIDEAMAERLGELLGPNKAFWLEREHNYRTAMVRIDPTYVPQDVAAEALEALSKALGGPPEGEANTLWAMAHKAAERLEMLDAELEAACRLAGEALKEAGTCRPEVAQGVLFRAVESIAAISPEASGYEEYIDDDDDSEGD